MHNIKFSYLYRDAGNYKNFGEVIFTNPDNLLLPEVDQQIRLKLIDSLYFYPKQWNLPTLHFEQWDEELDHDFHEYEGVEFTSKPSNVNLSIKEFLKLISTNKTK